MGKEDPTLYISCPVCGGKTDIKVCPDTVLLNFPLVCAACGKETKVNVADLKMVICEKSAH